MHTEKHKQRGCKTWDGLAFQAIAASGPIPCRRDCTHEKPFRYIDIAWARAYYSAKITNAGRDVWVQTDRGDLIFME